MEFTSSSKLGRIQRALRSISPGATRGQDVTACGLLVLLSVVFPWQLSVLGRLPSSIDFLLQYYPNLAFLGRGLRSGDPPLWNPHSFAGTPYLADPQSAVLYFPNWIPLLLLDTADAARVIVVAHYALAALGAYLYLRVLRLSPAASLVGALFFGLSEYTMTQVAGIPLLINLAWIPVILAMVELSLQKRSLGHALAAAAALALQLFNGWLYGLYITAFAILATYLWHMAIRVLNDRDWRAALQPTALMGAMSAAWAALGAALLLPALEFTGLSNYLLDRGMERAGGEGNVTVLAVLGVGGSEGHGAYLGVVGLLLVLFGAIHGRDRKRVLLFLLLGGFALLTAFGTKAPLYAYLYQWVPGFKSFHTPGRFMVIYLLCTSALAAYGTDAILKGVGRRQALMVAGTAVLLLAPLYYTMTRMFAPEALGLLANNLINWAAGPYLSPDVAKHIFFSVIGAMALLVAVGSGLVSRRILYPLILLLVVADLFLMRSLGGQYFLTPANSFDGTPLLTQLEDEATQQDPFRTMGYARNGTMHILSDLPGKLVPNLMPPNLSMVYDLEDIQGYNPLQLRRYAQYVSAINGGPDDYHWALIYNFQSKLLDLLNLRYVTLRGDDSRMANVTLAIGLNLETSLPAITVQPKPIRASGLQVQSYLGYATEMKDGQVAARLKVKDGAGQIRSFDLRAGKETAEWAYDRPDVVGRVAHQRARIAMTWNLPTPVHTYVAEIAFQEPMEIREITLERVEPDIFIVAPEVAAVPASPSDRYQLVKEQQGTKLFRNNSALPRALLVPTAEVVHDPAAALRRLQDDDFDGRERVILEGPGAPGNQGTGPEVGNVKILSRTNNSIKLSVQAKSYGFLLLNELSYPGWNAYSDGLRTRVWRANYLFRAVEVSPGDHEIEFRFEPDSFKLGLALTLPSLALLLAFAVYRMSSRRPWKENIPR